MSSGSAFFILVLDKRRLVREEVYFLSALSGAPIFHHTAL